ncbi:MAG: hypothetical protein NC231_14000 [Bacillus sp. (in: Bacteria)]|nr:hypothetical protein [Bacillus sp. (in: firmicutes)]MCM1426636.1 hypothetical protein [Eubacterium sp.]
MKKIVALLIMFMCIFGLTACVTNGTDTFNTSGQDKPEKIYDDIDAENIKCVTISGNASSIVIRQNANEYFEFYNGDLNTAHIYEINCDENDNTVDINIMMGKAKEDNDILGSIIIDVPQKEFEKFEIIGDFRSISLYTLNSDVLISECESFVNLDLEADRLEHNITLDNSGLTTFTGVSVYMDKFPENVKMKLNLLQGGTINDPQDILKEHGLESGLGKPVISINDTNKINIYSKE